LRKRTRKRGEEKARGRNRRLVLGGVRCDSNEKRKRVYCNSPKVLAAKTHMVTISKVYHHNMYLFRASNLSLDALH